VEGAGDAPLAQCLKLGLTVLLGGGGRLGGASDGVDPGGRRRGRGGRRRGELHFTMIAVPI